MKSFILPVLILSQITYSLAQPPSSTPLAIGDTMPDLTIDHVINYPTESVKISGFKDKVLILDFWSTFCTPCIEAFPKYDSLQRKLGDKLQVLLVTAEPEAAIRKLWGKLKYLRTVNLPSVTQDRQLHRLFDITMVPQVVWINDKGIVSAFTSLHYLTEDRINELLQGKQPNWPVVKSIADHDYDQPLVKTATIGANTASLQAYSALTGYIPGLKSYSHITRDTINNRVRWYIINQPANFLYKHVLGFCGFSMPNNRLMLEIKDSSGFVRQHGDNRTDWNLQHSYCYEGNLPMIANDTALLHMFFADLNRFFNLHARIEKRSTPCLVISVQSRKLLYATADKSGKPLAHYLPAWESFSPLPLLNETGYTKPITLPYVSSLDQLHKMLEKHGLLLQQAYRTIDMLVISDY